jgi:hypothetical protein
MNSVVLVDKHGNVLGPLSNFGILMVPNEIIEMGDVAVDGYAAERDDHIPLIAVDDMIEAGSMPGQIFVGGVQVI